MEFERGGEYRGLKLNMKPGGEYRGLKLNMKPGGGYRGLKDDRIFCLP